MILTKKAFNIGISKPIELRLKEYKRWRKYKKPFCKLTSFICCYGELNTL